MVGCAAGLTSTLICSGHSDAYVHLWAEHLIRMLTNIAGDLISVLLFDLRCTWCGPLSVQKSSHRNYSLQFSIKWSEEVLLAWIMPRFCRASNVKGPFAFAIRSCRWITKLWRTKSCKQALNGNRENGSANVGRKDQNGWGCEYLRFNVRMIEW